MNIEPWKKAVAVINKKLSSSQLFLLLCLNAAGPFLAYGLSKLIFSYQYQSPRAVNLPEGEFNRIFLLVLLMTEVSLVVINIINILNPLVKLENIIERFRATHELPADWEEHSRDCALEKAFFEIMEQQKESSSREYKTEMLRQQAELMALQSQINPHFLYNTLDSIRGLALIHDIPQIADMTEALSKLFRSMVAKEGKLIMLSEELQLIDSYMLIQQFRFHNKFKYDIRVDGSELLSCKVPNLILQPLVENAVVHGLEKKEGSGVIKIYAYATQSRLVISVEDNGMGIDQKKLEQLNARLRDNRSTSGVSGQKHRMGIALSNINQRIKLQFGENYGLNIMSTQNISTTVELVLPIMLKL